MTAKTTVPATIAIGVPLAISEMHFKVRATTASSVLVQRGEPVSKFWAILTAHCVLLVQSEEPVRNIFHSIEIQGFEI